MKPFGARTSARAVPLALTLTLGLSCALAACGSDKVGEPVRSSAPSTPAATSSATSPAPSTPSTPSSAAAAPTSPTSPAATPTPTPPAWLGTRVLPQNPDGSVPAQQTPADLVRRAFTLPDSVAPVPGDGFASAVIAPAPAAVIARSTWRAGCPVAAGDLAWIRLSFWGFDDRRHTGELLVAATQRREVVRAFHTLYDLRFPIEEMRIATRAEQAAAPTGDGNNTTAFNCRVVRGATSWSEHAYGLAVDVNPFQNPYVKGSGAASVVLPELARAYVDRADVRPGMIEPGSPAVRAFGAVGWGWGGAWRSLKDLQHFSARDR